MNKHWRTHSQAQYDKLCSTAVRKEVLKAGEEFLKNAANKGFWNSFFFAQPAKELENLFSKEKTAKRKFLPKFGIDDLIEQSKLQNEHFQQLNMLSDVTLLSLRNEAEIYNKFMRSKQY